ncbi:MAG: hypothetical protein PARBA_02389 [Parabacteroides sp.]
MKKLVLGMLAMTVLVGCSSNNDPVDEVGNGEKVEIKLNAGVVGVETKAAIATEGSDITAFTNTTVPLFRMDASTDPTWASVTSSVDATINGSIVTLDATQKYYVNDLNAYFIGYYSQLTPTVEKNVLKFSGVDGTKDIICTNQVDAGNKTTPTASAVLTFNHMVSKIAINIMGTAAAQQAFGNITKIELVNIPTSIDITLGKTASIAANTASASASIILYDDDVTGTAIPTAATSIGVIPKIFNGGATPYGTVSAPLKLKIYTKNNTGGIEVSVTSIEGGLELGKTHTITLTFKDQIGVTSAISGWENSSHNGSGEVG